jgi:putative Holliday junction resolvase
MSVKNIGPKSDAVVIGIDFGDVKNGLALGHVQTKTAVGLKSSSTTELHENLTQLVKENNVTSFVVGLPYNLSHGETARTEKTYKLIELLQTWFTIPVEIIDERWTTKEAKKRSPKGDDDQGAAILITQTYLDSL